MKIREHVSNHHSFMYVWILGAVLVLGGLVYSYIGAHPEGVLEAKQEGDVRTLVAAFGNHLNSVSLLMPEAGQEIAIAYGPYVTPELLNAWIAEPLSAPGRATSSPWPDHIEVDSVAVNVRGDYDVTGRVVLMDSVGHAGYIPVSLTVSDSSGSFLISRYEETVAADDETEAAETPSTVTASLGETVLLGSISITPLEVLEDSRCPEDVACIQAGTVRLRATLSSTLGSGTKEFVLGASVPTEAESIGFAAAAPAKISTDTINDGDYRFTFHIEPR